MDSKVQMITFVSKEQRYSGSSTQSIVIGEFHKQAEAMYTNCLADSCRKSVSTAPEFDLSVWFVRHLLDGNRK